MVALFLLGLLVPTASIQSQVPMPEPVTDSAIAEWLVLDTDAWAWDVRLLHPEAFLTLYASARIRGFSEAHTVSDWCCEQQTNAYTRSRNAWHDLAMRLRGLEDESAIDDAGAVVCAAVCRLSSADCERCIEDPSDAAWLQIPGVCHGIVQR